MYVGEAHSWLTKKIAGPSNEKVDMDIQYVTVLLRLNQSNAI